MLMAPGSASFSFEPRAAIIVLSQCLGAGEAIEAELGQDRSWWKDCLT